MQWLMVSFKLCASLAAVLASNLVWALDESRLWLPKKYHSHYINLVKAAEAANKLDQCVDVLEGTLDLGQSTPEHPMYRILCRQPSGRSYNEMVDGITFEPHNKPDPEAEARKKEREEQKRRLESWEICEAEILAQSKKMIEFQRLTDEQPEPVVWEEGVAEYQFDFDAKSVWGDPLQYRATCTIRDENPPEVQILKRRE